MTSFTNHTLCLCFILLFLSTCKPEKKIINGLPTTIYTEYNPIPLSLTCENPQSAKISIPKPHLYVGPPGTVDTSFQILKVSIDDVYHKEYKVSNDFTYLKDGETKRRSRKLFEFEIPKHTSLGMTAGIINFELYFNDKLIDDSKAKFKFLENDEEITIVHKTGWTKASGGREPSIDKTYNFRIKESGNYADKITYNYSVKNIGDQYEIKTKALGGKIYKVEESGKKKYITTIPASQEISTLIPLDYQLKEVNDKKQILSIGSIVLKDEDRGKVPGYVYYYNQAGLREKVKYSNCTKTIVSEEPINFPRISSWAPLNEN